MNIFEDPVKARALKSALISSGVIGLTSKLLVDRGWDLKLSLPVGIGAAILMDYTFKYSRAKHGIEVFNEEALREMVGHQDFGTFTRSSTFVQSILTGATGMALLGGSMYIGQYMLRSGLAPTAPALPAVNPVRRFPNVMAGFLEAGNLIRAGAMKLVTQLVGFKLRQLIMGSGGSQATANAAFQQAAQVPFKQAPVSQKTIVVSKIHEQEAQRQWDVLLKQNIGDVLREVSGDLDDTSGDYSSSSAYSTPEKAMRTFFRTSARASVQIVNTVDQAISNNRNSPGLSVASPERAGTIAAHTVELGLMTGSQVGGMQLSVDTVQRIGGALQSNLVSRVMESATKISDSQDDLVELRDDLADDVRVAVTETLGIAAQHEALAHLPPAEEPYRVGIYNLGPNDDDTVAVAWRDKGHDQRLIPVMNASPAYVNQIAKEMRPGMEDQKTDESMMTQSTEALRYGMTIMRRRLHVVETSEGDQLVGIIYDQVRGHDPDQDMVYLVKRHGSIMQTSEISKKGGKHKPLVSMPVTYSRGDYVQYINGPRPYRMRVIAFDDQITACQMLVHNEPAGTLYVRNDMIRAFLD